MAHGPSWMQALLGDLCQPGTASDSQHRRLRTRNRGPRGPQARADFDARGSDAGLAGSAALARAAVARMIKGLRGLRPEGGRHAPQGPARCPAVAHHSNGSYQNGRSKAGRQGENGKHRQLPKQGFQRMPGFGPGSSSSKGQQPSLLEFPFTLQARHRTSPRVRRCSAGSAQPTCTHQRVACRRTWSSLPQWWRAGARRRRPQLWAPRPAQCTSTCASSSASWSCPCCPRCAPAA